VPELAHRPWPCAAPQRPSGQVGSSSRAPARGALQSACLVERARKRRIQSQPLVRFDAPPACSAARVRLPRGLTSPGTFRPWAFHPFDGFLLSRPISPYFRREALLGFKASGVIGSPRICSRFGVLRRDPTNRCLCIPASRNRQDTCPSLGHAGSHPVFERSKPLTRRVRHSPMHLRGGVQGVGHTRRPISRDRPVKMVIATEQLGESEETEGHSSRGACRRNALA
jgi:hypothetical protein